MKLLERSTNRADSAEVFRISSKSIPVKFTSGELESVKSYDTTGVALRLIKEGKLGFSTTTYMNDLDEIVDKAIEASTIGEKVSFQFPTPNKTATTTTFDPEVEKVKADELIGLGQGVIKDLHNYDQALSVDVSLKRSISNIEIRNSNGLHREERRSGISISVEVQQIDSNDIFSLNESVRFQTRDQLDLSTLLNRTKKKLKWAREKTNLENGNYPVIFTPKGLVVLLLPLIVGFDGMNVFQGASPLGGKLDQKIFAENFSLRDGGVIADSPSKRSFDDEGIPADSKQLIANGVINTFLHDLRSASLLKARPTGNGIKGGLIGDSDFRNMPNANPTSMAINPGHKTLGKIIANVDKGLLVDQVLGLGQGNVLSGEFSNNVNVAYKIDKGAIAGRVKNTMIAGNVYDLLQGPVTLSQEPLWVNGIKTPAVGVDGVSVIQK